MNNLSQLFFNFYCEWRANASFSGRRAGRTGWSNGTTSTSLDLACPLQALLGGILG
ncbi:MAG TPA: hypothetical protein VK851_14450 [Anaerolineales bacterium]|nr:hypothetical protein [Anaerolineales bacterium]